MTTVIGDLPPLSLTGPPAAGSAASSARASSIVQSRLGPAPPKTGAIVNAARSKALTKLAGKVLSRGFGVGLGIVFAEEAFYSAADLVEMADASWSDYTADRLRMVGDKIDQVKSWAGAVLADLADTPSSGEPTLAEKQAVAGHFFKWAEITSEVTGKPVDLTPPGGNSATDAPAGSTGGAGGGYLPTAPGQGSGSLPAARPDHCVDIRSAMEVLASLRGKLGAMSGYLGVSPRSIREAIKIWSGMTDCERHLLLSDMELEL